ncbi:MFS transporter [Solihabitans fulvus]|uniref:MFS transporter n=1 Tax=Solihabitans fulvus TaxID=1892852 RepID=A0A5B2WWP4_9PSEU|nr:MFS transporter [Solihabitans fulvus]KAA2254876.1 MFS transporter [Solihabitans fulvus]
MSTPAPAPVRSRWLALAVLCAGMLMIILDGSIVTVALPSIQRDLGFTPSGLTWIVNAYLIAFGGLLLLAGRLGDLIGRKRMFLAGLAVFTLASLLCGLAVGPATLIGARFLQGVGGAMASSVSLGMIVALFTDPRERARAIGAFSFVGASGAAIGQVLGGVLTEAANWHWIFFINIPIGLVAVLLATRQLAPERGLGLAAGADAVSAALVTAGVMLGVYTIVGTEEHGWGSAHTLGLGAVTVVLLAAFVARQARSANPLLPLRVLRSRNVWGANLIQAMTIGAMFGFQILVAMYLQKVLGYGAADTGLAMLPAAVAIGTVSLAFSARLIARFGPRAVLLTGLGLLLVGLALLTRTPVHGDYVTNVLPVMVLIGGGGLVLPSLAGLAMSGATPSDSGVASGLFNTTQQVGAALGLAVLSTLAASRSAGLVEGGADTASALTGGYHLAFGVAAGLLAAAMLVAAFALRPKTASTAAGDEIPVAATV